MMDTDEKQIELKKLSLEITKARWSAAAVMFSVLSAALTVGYGAWSVRRTAEEQLVTKIVEVTFNADTADVTASKAAGIAYLFGNHLPEDIRTNLQDSNKVRDTLARNIGSGPDPAIQKEVLRLVLAAKPSEESRILSTWKRMFPGDAEWIDRFSVARK